MNQMTNQEIGNYLKSKAKSSGDFISIYFPSAYHTLDVLTHFFFEKKHEWFAICFLDEYFQCHAIWLEKGSDNLGVSVIISKETAIKFAKLNNFSNIIIAHNHIVTFDDLSYYKSKGINMNPLTENRRQHYLRLSEADKSYSRMWLLECEKNNLGFVSSVITAGEFYTEGHQKILNNITANKPIERGFRNNIIQSNQTTTKQPNSYKKLIFKAGTPTSKLSEYKGLIGYFGLSNWWNTNFTLEEQSYISHCYNNKIYAHDTKINNKLTFLFDCMLTEKDIEKWLEDLKDEEEEEKLEWTQSLFEFLRSLIIGFENVKDREISIKILENAEKLINESTPILDVHFFYLNKITTYYKLRNVNSKYLEIALFACKQQVGISHLASKAFRNYTNECFIPNRKIHEKFMKLFDEEGKYEEVIFIPSHTGYEKLTILLEKERKYEEVIALCQKAQNEGWNGDWQKRIDRCKMKLSKQNK